MQLVHNGLRYKRILDSELWVDKNGTAVLKITDGGIKEVNIVFTVVGTRRSKIATHHSGITQVVARLVLLAWAEYPENYNDFRINFIDGDSYNTNFENLEWERWCKETAGEVRRILETNLWITADGTVYRKYTDNCFKMFNFQVSALGYVQVNHSEYWLTRHRHRLVALAWLEVPEGWEELQVNHIDSIPGNDNYSNLEWTTAAGNTLHSIMQGRKGKGLIYLYNRTTDTVVTYPSVENLANAMGLEATTLMRRVEREVYPIIDSGMVGYDKDALVKQPYPTDYQLYKLDKIKLIDEITNLTIKECICINELSGYLKIKPGAVRKRIKKLGSHIGDGYIVESLWEGSPHRLKPLIKE